MFSDWTAAGTRNTNIDFDLESHPLQVQTDSVFGNGDLLWVRFVKLNFDDGPGINIKFNDPPTYTIGWCSNITNDKFTLPGADKHKIWTISKQNGKLQLNGNGVELFDFNFKESELDCRTKWAWDFAYIKFMSKDSSTDTASDMFRQFTKGKQFSTNNCDLYVFRGSDVDIITAKSILYAIYIRLIFTNVCKAVC